MRIRGYRTGAFMVGVLCVFVGMLAFEVSAALAVAPTIEAESFSDVGPSSATLSATMNANGVLTSYRFEYSKDGDACFASESCVKAPSVSLGASSEGVAVSSEIGELEVSTAYEFRVLVSNAEGESVAGALERFTTLPSGLLGLPDGRGYEMVTPPDNENAEVYTPAYSITPNAGEGISTTRLSRAAANGDAVAFVSDPTVGGSGSAGEGTGNENLATRSAAGGWVSRSIQPAGKLFDGFAAFSSDLSVGFVESPEPLSPQAPPAGYRALYEDSLSTGDNRAIFTGTPPNRSVNEFSALYEERLFAGASANLSHVLFEANDTLTENALEAPLGGEEDDLYDSVAGKLYLVNVLPDGRAAGSAAFGRPSYHEGAQGDALEHVISDDGSRVFWSTAEIREGKNFERESVVKALYVRENDTQPQSPLGPHGECMVPADACTVQLDASQASGPGGGGLFWTASSNGSEVFFTDSATAGLTSDTVPGSGENLYMYDISTGKLTDLTPVAEASVQGVAAADEDGQYIYFVATGVLSTSPNAQGAAASAGADNLYVLHLGEQPRFIGTLTNEDGLRSEAVSENVPHGVWAPSLSTRTAEATPDGRHLVFVSQESLTGYGNKTTQVPRGMNEAYLYDVESGSLTCVSCARSGEVPPNNFRLTAGFVPMSGSNLYQPRWISQDGNRLFFDSAEPLVAQDTNGKPDVYEWERDRAGSCNETGGCVYLLSGGVSESASWLLDASTSGDDVFVISRAKLVPQDGNENFDVYDARVGTAQSLAQSVCSGAGCQGVPPAPPAFATPASVTFAGVGNLPPGTGSVVKVKSRGLTKAQKLARSLRRCRTSGRARPRRRACEVAARKRYRAMGRSKRSSRKGGK